MIDPNIHPPVQAIKATAEENSKRQSRCHCVPTWAKVVIVIIFLSVLVGLGIGTAVYVVGNQKQQGSQTGDENPVGIINATSTLPPVTAAPTGTLRPTAPTTRTPTIRMTRSPSSPPSVAAISPTFRLTKSPTRQPSSQSPTSPPIPDDMKFNIELRYTSPMSDEQKTYFQAAAERWQKIIVADFASTVRATKGLSICGQPPLTEDLYIDDILIFASITTIDGPGKILAQAGPCGFDNAGRIRVGVMKFDKDDLNNNFQAVVRHEMGHVLGIGSMWDERDLLTPIGQLPIYYLGTNGNIGHREIGGSGNLAVVETEGGPGTARSHWKEQYYQTELMTGFLSGTMTQPISRMTVRALADIGFTVDLNQADPYQVPVGRRLLRSGKNAKDIIRLDNDIYNGPVHHFVDSTPKKGREAEHRKNVQDYRRRKRKRKRNNNRSIPSRP